MIVPYQWHRVVAFGRLADNCQRLLSKGRQVYVEGRLNTRQYQAKDGTGLRYRTEIVAQQLRLLGSQIKWRRSSGSGSFRRNPILTIALEESRQAALPYPTSNQIGVRDNGCVRNRH
jgi:single stranded DNA-binding protein